MQLAHEKKGEYLLIKADGRLDATWSEYFTDTLLTHIRQGLHHLVIDAGRITFLSSAGIRALIIIYKELVSVKGTFRIVNAGSFVLNTLTSTGLQAWISVEPISELLEESFNSISENAPGELYVLHADASLYLSIPVTWKPWQRVNPENPVRLSFHENVFALGIGSAAESFTEACTRFGEFLAISGNVVFQPPEEGAHPDYLISENNYIPGMLVIQSLYCSGQMSHLLRFSPNADKQFFTVNQLASGILSITRSKAAGFVILGEIEGIVGATMIQSPGLYSGVEKISFPDIRDWISFTGERAFTGQQALIFGIACKKEVNEVPELLTVPDPESTVASHVHAVVFTYQPIQNGNIDLKTTLKKFFDGPPPRAIMHLVNDVRPAVGLGETTLVRGACWFAHIKNPEVLL